MTLLHFFKYPYREEIGDGMLISILFTLCITTFFNTAVTQLPVHIQSTICTRQSSVLSELPIVVLICSYNNAPWVAQNLESVRMQKYTNWRIIYFDDASDDGTSETVIQYLETHNLSDKCTLITHQTRGRKLKNLYTAFHHYIDDNEIILQLDGDDWLAHDHVFSLINSIYQEHDVWLTYGNYQNVPAAAHIGQELCFMPQEIVENNQFRNINMFMHLRTFYGWLAKQIKLPDLMSVYVPNFKSNFFPASNDAATMWAMFEMAGNHFAFIEEILYHLNRTNPLNGFKVDRRLQRRSSAELKRKIPAYQPLEKPILNHAREFQQARASCVILSENNPEKVQRLLNSLNKHAQGIDEIWLFFEANTPELEARYYKLQLDYPNDLHTFLINGSSFNTTFLSWLKECTSKHLFICRDTVELNDDVDISSCILELERTGAYAFYLSVDHEHAHIPSQHVWDDLYASKFYAAENAWFNTLDMTLLRTDDVQKRILSLNQSSSITHFISLWTQDLSLDLFNAGLFFDASKVCGQLSSLQTPLPELPKLMRFKPRRQDAHRASSNKSLTREEKKELRAKKLSRSIKKCNLYELGIMDS